MKFIAKICRTVAVAAIVLCGAGQSAKALSPFQLGIKAGVNINEMKFNKDAFASDNRSGFTGGVMVKFVAPIINIGCDASVMYTHRNTKLLVEDPNNSNVFNATSIGNDYIEIPINFRWNIGLPIINNVISPFLATGPDFSFLVSNKNVKSVLSNRKFDFAWNFGVGLTIVKHVEIAATYGLGIKNSASGDMSLYGHNTKDANGKNRFWTVTAAYLF